MTIPLLNKYSQLFIDAREVDVVHHPDMMWIVAVKQSLTFQIGKYWIEAVGHWLPYITPQMLNSCVMNRRAHNSAIPINTWKLEKITDMYFS